MPQSLANILVHLIFSTRNRERFIEPDIEDELYPYLASICRACESPSHAVGGTEDHVHIALTLGRTISVAKLIAEIKASSSKWIKTKGPRYTCFAWQNGYEAFSIGQSQLPALKPYIAGQKEHHRRRTYQEEFRDFLERYAIAYDERYVWDCSVETFCLVDLSRPFRARIYLRAPSPGLRPGLSYFAPSGLGRPAHCLSRLTTFSDHLWARPFSVGRLFPVP
jgi:putative transposase